MSNVPLDLSMLKKVTSQYKTPFYLYDEKAIRENVRRLKKAFAWNEGFREYFAVKATPNPHILTLFKKEGCGVDCASETELLLAASCSFSGEEIMFSSNVTTAEEFIRADKLNAIINLDDISHIEYLQKSCRIPELICLRFNPGGTIRYQNTDIIDFDHSKFGFTKRQLMKGLHILNQKEGRRFGLHCQFGCHRREADYFGENARMLFQEIVDLFQQTGIRFEFINLAGGVGIPYHDEDSPTDIEAISREIRLAYEDILGAAGLIPTPIYLELGIYMTGPYGYFISSVLHIKENTKTLLGLDASTNSFMSPSRYSDYHRITVAGKEQRSCSCIYDITGALCENRDRFADDRALPPVEKGDFLIFHDAGAYTYSHSNNFNGRLRPAELLLCQDDQVRLIRRAETPSDYFSTLNF